MSRRMLLHVLYDPEPAGQGPPALDLVLIHGLDGDPLKTWTNPATNTCWPKDLFPLAHPQTRVLSFGYNGDMYRNNSVAGIRGNARALLSQLRALRYGIPPSQQRPIIFLAHCLGGLIVKQALVFANAEDEHRAIATATRTLLFFGTPHFGSSKPQWRLLADRFSALDAPPTTKKKTTTTSLLAKALIRDSSDLLEISEDFCQLTSHYNIITYYETLAFPGTNTVIVDATSARMMVANERDVPVDAHHGDLCRFGDARDPTLVDVFIKVEEVVPAKPARRVVAGLVKAAERRQVSWEVQSVTSEEADGGIEGMAGIVRTMSPLQLEYPAGEKMPWREAEVVKSPVEVVVGEERGFARPEKRRSSRFEKWLKEIGGGRKMTG